MNSPADTPALTPVLAFDVYVVVETDGLADPKLSKTYNDPEDLAEATFYDSLAEAESEAAGLNEAEGRSGYRHYLGLHREVSRSVAQSLPEWERRMSISPNSGLEKPEVEPVKTFAEWAGQASLTPRYIVEHLEVRLDD